MSDKKIIDVANKLLGISKKRELKWSRDRFTEDKFSVDFPDSSVSISRTPSGDYIISVLNDLGTEVESLRTSKKTERNPRETGDPVKIPKEYYTFEELFGIARRSALKPDAVLDDLLARLSADK